MDDDIMFDRFNSLDQTYMEVSILITVSESDKAKHK